MAARTLKSTWDRFEKLVRKYEETSPPCPDAVEALDDLSRKTNNSKIVDALASLFVRTYQGMEDAGVRFATSGDCGYPDWITTYSPEEKEIVVNPIGVCRFGQECEESVDALKTPVGRKDFQAYRYHAYLAELRKLPRSKLLFLQLLKEVANACEITHVEKKGGGLEDVEDENYMILLWAFKELELFFEESSGVSLRSEYRILWYESDWISGKKKKR